MEEFFGKDAYPSDILALFLKEQKKELLRRKNNLTMAVYEYFFAHKVPKKDNLLKKRFDICSDFSLIHATPYENYLLSQYSRISFIFVNTFNMERGGERGILL